MGPVRHFLQGKGPGLVPPQLEPQHIKPCRGLSGYDTSTGCQILADQAWFITDMTTECQGRTAKDMRQVQETLVRNIEPVARHRMWQLTVSQRAPTLTFSDICVDWLESAG